MPTPRSGGGCATCSAPACAWCASAPSCTATSTPPAARPCGAVQESAGRRVGVGNRKAGNAWLKWAFSEAAVLSAQKDERIGRLLERLASKLGKPKALSALAHKLGRAFYHMLHTKEVFDINRFVRH